MRVERLGQSMGDNGTQDGAFVPSYLLYLLAASSEAASAQFHARVREHGLRVPEWRVLACLSDQDGLMITKLAEYSLAEQSRLTRIVDQMDRNGLVERRIDPGDRRRVKVHLTPSGRELADKLVDEARQHEAKLLSILEDTDASRLKQALQALLSTLDRPVPGEQPEKT